MENKETFEVDAFTKASINAEWVESPNSIDLRSCLRGNELLCKDGTIIYYVQPLPNSIYDHEISYDLAGKKLGSRTNAGKMLKSTDSDSDVIEIIRK